ncbi:hypothetical protein SAMN05518847_11834 [Paenibacillus sp. OV219]|nr:hypothetical protein SAMN05518847_11834 [Paenibacillus sp. OV219]
MVKASQKSVKFAGKQGYFVLELEMLYEVQGRDMRATTPSPVLSGVANRCVRSSFRHE